MKRVNMDLGVLFSFFANAIGLANIDIVFVAGEIGFFSLFGNRGFDFEPFFRKCGIE